MANHYTLGLVGNVVHLIEKSFIVRGGSNLDKVHELIEQGYDYEEIARSFCSYCLCYFPLEEEVCVCGKGEECRQSGWTPI